MLDSSEEMNKSSWCLVSFGLGLRKAVTCVPKPHRAPAGIAAGRAKGCLSSAGGCARAPQVLSLLSEACAGKGKNKS